MRQGLQCLSSGLLLLLAAVLVSDSLDWRHHRDQLIDTLRTAGLDEQDAAFRRVGRETDSSWATLYAARALLDFSTEARPGAPRRSPSPGLDSLARSIPALVEAERLANEALSQRPFNWQAALVLGESRYLAWLAALDPRLFTERDRWHGPLDHARRVAPRRTEPRELLADHLLSNWSQLSPSTRSEARDLVRQCFEREPCFKRLIPLWLQASGDDDGALDVLPSRPGPWRILSQVYGRSLDWERCAMTYERWEKELLSELERRAEAVESEPPVLSGTEQQDLFRQIGQLPLDQRFLPPLARLLRAAPPPPAHQRKAVDRLLAWSLDLCTWSTCPLEESLLTRLSQWRSPLSRAEEAQLLLAVGRESEAEAILRTAEQNPGVDTRGSAWQGYWLLRARRHLDRGQPEVVVTLFQQLPYFLRTDTLAQRLLARAEAEAIDSTLRRDAPTVPQHWQPSLWQIVEDSTQLNLELSQPASGLEIEHLEPLTDGAVLKILWDGTGVDVLVVSSEQSWRLERPIEPGLHRLEWILIAGGPVRPGVVKVFEG